MATNDTTQPTFFFYDLETTGISPRDGRIMQFAGQRTDMDLNPVGEPYDIMVKLTPDILPEPDAIMVTGITPQATQRDGVTEAEFVQMFLEEIVQPQTIFLGFNTVRFDDEFMRCTLYRNFAPPYEWHWKDGCSRWDLLDVVRMTRALRPEGIKWPFASDGKPTVRLEYLTKVNGLDHENAHDALNDVGATIAIAKLIRDKQPNLFQYLLKMRDKKEVAKLVENDEMFVYTTGRYASDTEKTSVATMLTKHPGKGCAVVYDLRHDPTEFLGMTPGELAERLGWVKDPSAAPARLQVKMLQYNRCPAVAPLSVLNDDGVWERLQLDKATLKKHRELLESAPEFAQNVLAAMNLNDQKRQTSWLADTQDVDCQIYDGEFYDDNDCRMLGEVRRAKPDELSRMLGDLHDKRLQALLPLYKARNYPAKLTSEEREEWDAFCRNRLFGGEANSRFAKFAKRIEQLAATKLTQNQQFALEELRLYAESIMPADL